MIGLPLPCPNMNLHTNRSLQHKVHHMEKPNVGVLKKNYQSYFGGWVSLITSLCEELKAECMTEKRHLSYISVKDCTGFMPHRNVIAWGCWLLQYHSYSADAFNYRFKCISWLSMPFFFSSCNDIDKYWLHRDFVEMFSEISFSKDSAVSFEEKWFFFFFYNKVSTQV